MTLSTWTTAEAVSAWAAHANSADHTHDVVLSCKGGAVVRWSRLFLAAWSPLVADHLRGAGYSCAGCDAPLVVVLPDFDAATVRQMLQWSSFGEAAVAASDVAAFTSLLNAFAVGVELVQKRVRPADLLTCPNPDCGQSFSKTADLDCHAGFCGVGRVSVGVLERDATAEFGREDNKNKNENGSAHDKLVEFLSDEAKAEMDKLEEVDGECGGTPGGRGGFAKKRRLSRVKGGNADQDANVGDPLGEQATAAEKIFTEPDVAFIKRSPSCTEQEEEDTSVGTSEGTVCEDNKEDGEDDDVEVADDEERDEEDDEEDGEEDENEEREDESGVLDPDDPDWGEEERAVSRIRTRKRKAAPSSSSAEANNGEMRYRLPEVPCKKCSTGFKFLSELKRHVAEGHFYDRLLDDYTVDCRECKACGKELCSPQKLVFHVGVTHGVVMEVVSDGVREQLEDMERRNNRAKLGKGGSYRLESTGCVSCANGFEHMSSLKSHLATVHFGTELVTAYGKGDPANACALCDRTFARRNNASLKNNIAYHVGSAHDKLFEFLSDEAKAEMEKLEEIDGDCGGTPGGRGGSSAKKRRLSRVKGGKFKLVGAECDSCRRGFEDLCRLRAHLAGTHYCSRILSEVNGGVDDRCVECGKDFSALAKDRGVRLATHVGLVHSGMAPMLSEEEAAQLEKFEMMKKSVRIKIRRCAATAAEEGGERVRVRRPQMAI